jgi:hypothetical protein
MVLEHEGSPCTAPAWLGPKRRLLPHPQGLQLPVSPALRLCGMDLVGGWFGATVTQKD